jgi:hypothetical protein
MTHASADAAFGAAHRALVERLHDLGLSGERAHALARDFLNELQRQGWRWRPIIPAPARPAAGAPPTPQYRAAKEALLEALHAEAEAMTQHDEPTSEGATA